MLLKYSPKILNTYLSLWKRDSLTNFLLLGLEKNPSSFSQNANIEIPGKFMLKNHLVNYKKNWQSRFEFGLIKKMDRRENSEMPEYPDQVYVLHQVDFNVKILNVWHSKYFPQLENC